MAEVITWRSMAGPNFAGTAAAMDAGADRISQLGTAFNQFAQDQTKIQADTKAKLKADNTAKVLAQLNGIGDLNQLNQQMPNFSYDSLRGQYGEDIDAGLIANTATKQAGVIQENQLRDMEFNIAKEKPIMGEGSELIAGLLNQGDIKGAKAAYEQYKGRLTDATPLADMITKYEADQFDKTLKTNADNRDQKRTAMAEKEHQLTINAMTDVQNIMPLVNDVRSGRKTASEAAAHVKSADGLIKFNQALESTAGFDELDPQQKLEVSLANAEITKQTAGIDMEVASLNRQLDLKPEENPAMVAFKSSIGGDRQKLINQLGTPDNIVSNKLSELGTTSSEGFDFEINETKKNTAAKYLRKELNNAGIKMDDVDPFVMEAAISHWQVNGEGGIDDEMVIATVERVKDLSAKQETYKTNKSSNDAKRAKLNAVSTRSVKYAAELAQINLRKAEILKKQRNMQDLGGKTDSKAFKELSYEWDVLQDKASTLKDKLNEYNPQNLIEILNGTRALSEE